MMHTCVNRGGGGRSAPCGRVLRNSAGAVFIANLLFADDKAFDRTYKFQIERAASAGVPRRGARAGDKKLSEPVTLFAAIEAEQHEGLRAIAFSERRSLADVVREALNGFLARRPTRRRPVAAKR